MKVTRYCGAIAAICACLFLTPKQVACKENAPLIIDDSVVISTDDKAELSLLIVRPESDVPLPVALAFTIYAEQERSIDIEKASEFARRGYVSIIGYSRGKHMSTSEPRPYETETRDVNEVIDWASKQPWSDGRIAMYGGSYNGFSQWASLKHPHKALKTIVPYVAAIPGYGLPMENNVFLNANYGWPFHVTNNRYKDESIYQQHSRWNELNQNWFESGAPYRSFDSFDIRTNPHFQTWINHPDYDEYWQSMVPFGEEFSRINLPVLSITGYYDDGQISAIRYLQQHEKYHSSPEHFLVIGPYDHWSAQSIAGDTLRDLTLDPVARINIQHLTLDWFDYVLKGAPKPMLLKDKINYQVVGLNRWHSAPSLSELNNKNRRWFLGSGGKLVQEQVSKPSYSQLRVDFKDRQMQNSYYPWPIVSKHLPDSTGVVFKSAPLSADRIYAGQFAADLDIRLNRKDVDINLVLYELTPDGEYFHLSYFIGRASYARDMTKRQLLEPGVITSIPISGTRINAKKISKGSRIVLVANVNRNNFAQVNYGSGKDVSDESIKDAEEELTIDWMHSSHIEVPLSPILR